MTTVRKNPLASQRPDLSPHLVVDRQNYSENAENVPVIVILMIKAFLGRPIRYQCSVYLYTSSLITLFTEWIDAQEGFDSFLDITQIYSVCGNIWICWMERDSLHENLNSITWWIFFCTWEQRKDVQTKYRYLWQSYKFLKRILILE